MAHDGQRLAGCAERFGELDTEIAEVRGEIARLHNGADTKARALGKLTTAVETAAKDQKSEMKGLTDTVTGYHLTLVAQQTTTEASAKSAHHRLDTVRNVLLTLGGGGALALLGWLLSKVVP